MSGEPHLSKDNSGTKRPPKGAVLDDGASSVTSDSLTVLHKKFHFPNSLVATVPNRSDRASHPPPGCGVSIARFSHRTISVTIGLIALFRDRGVVLTPECISRMGRFIIDAQGRVTFRSKWLDIRTRDPLKSWASAFFFVKNDWGLIEKWGKLTDLPAPLNIGEEDIMRILKVPDIEHLLYEVRYLGRYIEEEFLFKVELSIHAGRSEEKMLKKSTKAPELPASAPVPVPKVAPKRSMGGGDPQSLKKKRMEGVAMSADKAPSSSSPVRMHIPEDVLNHQCIGHHRADDLANFEAELTHSLNEWNNEFVKVKYLQGEYKWRYDSRTKEVRLLEEELSECRIELANVVHSVSLQNQQIDRLQVDLEGAQAVITELRKDQKTAAEKVGKLEAENKRSRTLLAEKEAALSDLESSRIIEDFKKSIAFKSIIQDHVQEARDHIYDIELKDLELQCIDEGFIQGFLKGVRLMQRKTGITVEGLTPSQASGDLSSDADGDKVESELQKVFDLDVDDEHKIPSLTPHSVCIYTSVSSKPQIHLKSKNLRKKGVRKSKKTMDARVFRLDSPFFSSLQHLVEDLPEEMEKAVNAPTKTYVREARAMASTPADVKELPSAYEFVLDMPGVKSGEIKVQIEDGNVLTITGERRRDEEDKEGAGKYLRMERRVGKFMRKFSLPDNSNLENISAVCSDGVLKVTVQKLPPPEPKKPKTIEVKIA
ncbi:hypothetical protein M5K25_004841 [Dendrobium thyrsiflorum]|uniref:SHSP domain-containing protein n=1 Tax=Dendrobium thyrsiflorum TaxID=117978 RepID=A0ABD0VG12_DENTH